MTIEEMRHLKKQLGISNLQLSKMADIPLSTVQKIFSGATASPGYDTVLKLSSALSSCVSQSRISSEKASPSQMYDYSSDTVKTGMVRETASYENQPEKRLLTVDDYRALPDERRVELIDGKFYDMSAPTSIHQQLSGIINYLFLDYIWKSGGSCQAFQAPFDVQLDKDQYTMVQPDNCVICDPSKIHLFGCFGAPDLVIEILSPSTARKDLLLKAQKYERAGVREYWIIDHAGKRILVYDFEHDAFPRLYGFEDTIPVLIWNGDLQLDFAMISSRLILPANMPPHD